MASHFVRSGVLKELSASHKAGIMKICIGIPTNRGFKPKTVLSLARLLAYSKLDYFITIPTEGFNTAENRNLTVAQAIKNNCTHILFSDDDMAYPENTLEQLLSHDKDIIGALYNIRRLPPALVIEYLEDGVKSDEEAKLQTEPFRCKAIGTGFLLVKIEVFSKLQSPFFGYKWNDNGSVKMSTDWFFLEKVREAGYEVWAAPLQIKHLGEYEF